MKTWEQPNLAFLGITRCGHGCPYNTTEPATEPANLPTSRNVSRGIRLEPITKPNRWKDHP